jgi:hypothetical protein
MQGHGQQDRQQDRQQDGQQDRQQDRERNGEQDSEPNGEKYGEEADEVHVSNTVAAKLTKGLSAAMRKRLFDTSITDHQIVKNTVAMLPALRMSNPLVAGLLENIEKDARDRIAVPAPFYDAESTTWPSWRVRMGNDCDAKVAAKSTLTLVPAWLIMGKETLVKSRGTFESPMLIVIR